MEFTDTHSHLYDEAFSGEQDETIARAVNAGVTKIIFPDIDATTRDQMFSLASRHKGTIFPCLGLHPTSVGADWQKDIEKMQSYPVPDIFAIGEIGIDCYWSKEFVEEQKEAFRAQLRMASELSLPVIIHARESTAIILEILKEERHLDLRGVFHAYSGSIETFREIRKLGDWYVGIGGVVTFRKASIAETVKEIPSDRILLETDSPYLTPVPHRGTRNESGYIPLIAAKIAEVKNTAVEEIAAATTENAKRLFSI